MLTVTQAAQTPTYERARKMGYGATDAVTQARGSDAYRIAALKVCEEAKRKLARRKRACA
jgi:hypothetical protein